ncbi:hypothetical protein OAJ76_01360 [Candidatus Pelagibacter sp.]|nr:hypothetical protein [Candidatus Pelagibacter sp.]
MIIKKKLNQFPFINLILKIISKLIQIIGSISLLIIIFLTFYYFNSGMYERYKPLILLKKVDEIIINKYLGFSFFEIDDYISQNINSLKFIFYKNDLENVTLKINQKNLYNLELQRKNKIEGVSEKVQKFSRASLNYNQNDFNIQLRVKGDRSLHWFDQNSTSYKIDLSGDDRIWGLEEFSVQKPITRNYIYEFIFHRLLEEKKLIALKYFFINLSLNDTNQGIYAVEEGFSKELIERNKKRNGPIFGVEELKSFNYPKIEYDLYSKNYWQSNYSQLIKNASLKLNKIKKKNNNIENIFDLEKWATYFAIIDLTGNFHGSIPKSVKLFYNPVTAKFEPIGFDGHYNSNLFQKFLILDFLDIENKNCSYICSEREWYLRFLKNSKFKNIYFEKLKEISSEKFIKKFYETNIEKINFYNDQFLSDTSKKDRIFYKGIGLYIFNKNYLFERSKYIQSRIAEVENKLATKGFIKNEIFEDNNLLNKKEIKSLENNYILNDDIIIDENLYLESNKILNIQKGVEIYFTKDVTIYSEGSIFFNGTQEEPIVVYSDDNIGSIILSNNNFKLNNVIFKNLSYPKGKDKILYGGINIINSDVEIIDTQIASSNSEDAINIISSNSYIRNLKLKNIKADAIDIDFGNLNFTNITCENIDNDCLDISGANVSGNFIEGSYINDKGLSFGENAKGEISHLNFKNSKLGVAVKDGSSLKLSRYQFKNNEFDVVVFNKKKEYGEASLLIENSINNSQLNYLIGLNNSIIKDQNILTKKIDNKIINELFY